MSSNGGRAAAAPKVAHIGAERTGRVVQLGRLLPSGVRRFLGSAYGRLALRSLDQWGERVLRDDEAVVAGPYVSEVGFEVLYWIPFLRWALDRYGVPRRRIIAISRGGADAWYEGLCANYRDVFELLSPAEFAAGNRERERWNRGQKAMRVTSQDLEIVNGLVDPGAAFHLLHPSLMFRLFRPWFWEFREMAWVLSRTRFAPFAKPREPAIGSSPPGGYVAAKFYSNKAFPATEENRACARSIIRRIEQHVPVVQLGSGMTLDDHAEFALSERGVRGFSDGPLGARGNLLEQTRILAGASAFVGTYGGFSYVAPFCGVPSFALFSEPAGFHATHLRLAHTVMGNDGLADLTVSAAGEQQAAALADALVAGARQVAAASRGQR